VTPSGRARRLLILVPTPREALLLFGRDALRLGAPRLATVSGASVRIALCGFGLAAAGATAGRFLAQLAPDAVALAGVAGTLDPQALPIGALLEGDAVGCDGIGAGEAERFIELAEPQLPGTLAGGAEQRPLALAATADHAQRAGKPALARAVRGEILSVAACAATFSMAQARLERHPRALAEEMEGYAVALAALVAKTPLVILRGISNPAGDRDPRGWKVEEALAPVRAALAEWVELATTAAAPPSAGPRTDPR